MIFSKYHPQCVLSAHRLLSPFVFVDGTYVHSSSPAFGTSTASSGGLFGATNTASNPFGGAATGSLFGASGFTAAQQPGTALKFNVRISHEPRTFRSDPESRSLSDPIAGACCRLRLRDIPTILACIKRYFQQGLVERIMDAYLFPRSPRQEVTRW